MPQGPTLVALALAINGAALFGLSAYAFGARLGVLGMFVLLMCGLITYQTQSIISGGKPVTSWRPLLFVSIFNLFTSLLHLLGISPAEEI